MEKLSSVMLFYESAVQVSRPFFTAVLLWALADQMSFHTAWAFLIFAQRNRLPSVRVEISLAVMSAWRFKVYSV